VQRDDAGAGDGKTHNQEVGDEAEYRRPENGSCDGAESKESRVAHVDRSFTVEGVGSQPAH
jgi:hypothetical protein